MRANIKLNAWIPFLFILLVAFFLMQEFNVLDVVMILGGVVIVGYFVMGYIKRKDAIIIEGKTMTVKTPFKTTVFDLDNLSSVYFKERDPSVIKGVYNNDIVTVCGNIYDKDVTEIMAYLQKEYPHLQKQNETS